MIKDFFKALNKFLPSEPARVNKIIVTKFLESNILKPKNSSLIKSLIIDEVSNDWEEYILFRNYFNSYQTTFSFEDLIEIFELVVSPSDKKVNGAIYTPDNIKSYIIRQVISESIVDLTKALVCDVACGCGGFLYSYAQFLRDEFELSYDYIYRELIYGVDVAAYSIERSAITLALLAIGQGEDVDFQFNLKVGNSLDFNWRKEFPQVGRQNGFDFVIGNPPYVCAKNISLETRKLLSNWPVCASGNPDLYIPFFQVGLEALHDKGVLGYITVNSFTRSMNGRKIREYFHQQSSALTIVDFGGEQVFKGRTTYTCICIIGRQPRPYVQYCLSTSRELDSLAPTDFVRIPYELLTDYKGWELGHTSIKQVLHRLRSSGPPLGKVATIRGGFATLKNKVFVFRPVGETETHFKLETRNKSTFLIEKSICRNAVKANSLKTEEDFPIYEEKIIFPYKYQQQQKATLFAESPTIERKAIPLEEQEFIEKFPDAYAYLTAHRTELASRDKGATGDYDAWYAFGRTQGLNVQGYKLLFPHISDKPYFVYTEDSDLLFYTGFSIVSWEKHTLKVLQKILTSELFWFYVKHTSKPYSGDYFGLGTNYIKDFSIPVLTDRETDYLLSLIQQEDVTAFLLKKYGITPQMLNNQLVKPDSKASMATIR